MPLVTADLAALPRPGTDSTPAALVAVAHELGRVHDTFAFTPAAPDGDGWVALSAVTEAQVGAWLDRLTAAAGGHRTVAASYLVLRLTGSVATPLMAAYLLQGRGLPIDDEHAAVRLDGEQFDRLALPAGAVEVGPDDPVRDSRDVTGRPGPVPLDHDALAELIAVRLHTVLTPVIEAATRLARYSRANMWSAVADRLAGPAVLAANLGGLDPHECWRRTHGVVDRLAALGAPVRRRPRLLEIPWTGGTAVSTVKGTCCLKYLEQDLHPRDAAQRPQEFCGGCPYVGDDVRADRRRAALESPTH
ncbi:ferric iron reductase FhuF-like transporter [Haloactinopolyspora alba]|uniref:Ferric iron reductase FhuF-like transporter n=1 Tax=Haloactinopolyspora alba TaxID=648780 RepID=A0A2P8E2G1_9ACTN|nr:IucA/IucC family C-terminal-domain containing protein [Haloactinopolyspora alba]PSL03652.1 ferric iron reductase FhuF-like transporter [Haloactinopolyspora alba]